LGNSAQIGAGLSCESGTIVLNDCVLQGNFAFHRADGGPGGGGAIFCAGPEASVTLNHCTVMGNVANVGGGIAAFDPVTLTDCIPWDNAGGSLRGDDPSLVTATYSCIDGQAVWPGEGNINADPRFCGWGAKAEVHVDATASGPGDGSEADPYPDLASAPAFDVALSKDSPCVGSGSNGTDMGADRGICDAPGVPHRLVRLRAGTYAIRGSTVYSHASLAGAGEASSSAWEKRLLSSA